MKKRLALLIFVISIGIPKLVSAQLASWDFAGLNTVATATATAYHTDLTAAPVLSRGSGATASAGANSFRTVGFQNNGISTTNNDYFEVSLTVNTGKKLSITSIDAKFAGTATYYASPGVTSQFAYSLDGSTFTLIGSPVQSTSLSYMANLAGVAALQDVPAGTTITLRYYASGQTTTGGWGFSSSGSSGFSIGGTINNVNTAVPTLTANPTSLAFGNQNVGDMPMVQSYNLSGVDLTSGFNVATTTPFSVSKDNVLFGNSISYTLAEAQSSKTVYVKFTPTVGGSVSGTVTNTSTGATPANVALSGIAFSSVINTASSSIDFGAVDVGITSTPQAYTLSGTGLVGPVTLTTAAPFELSKNNISYSTSLTYSTAELNFYPAVFVRYKPTTAVTSNGMITHTSNGAQNKTITLTGTGMAPTVQPHVVISEVYGGGGNAGSVYKNDFIELYNPTLSPIDLTNWSVQYASATGTSWQVTPLSGSIGPKSFYLIQEAAGSGGTTNLPNPDKIGTIAMAATAGKVLLANVSTAQTGSMPTGSAIVDFVGFGAANAYEGTGPTVAPSATFSVERKASATSDAISLGVGGSEEFSGNGFDSDDNAFDFVSKTANPQNSTSTEPIPIGGPYLNTNPNTIVFTNQTINTTSASKNYTLSAGNLTNPTSVTVTGPYIISKDNITFSSSINFSIAELNANQSVYVKFSPIALGNATGTILHESLGATAVNVNLSGYAVNPNQTSFNFENCATAGSSTLSDGFYQYSLIGPQTWGCTTGFGHDPSDATGKASIGNAIQINGYASVNIQNVDWLISPALDLSSMNYAILSFWTRSAFTGDKLQLKVSTDYSGTGDPSLATWTSIDGKFPETASDTWTKSDFIDLTAYKAQSVYIAFVYNSTTTSASRWTVDDFAVTNSNIHPPVDVNIGNASLNFGFQAAGTTSVARPFSFSVGNLTGDVTLTAPANFTISATINGTFGNTVSLAKSAINNTSPTVYAKFSPVVPNTTYSGNVSITTSGSITKNVSLTGNTFDTANTLEVVNWNIEWFGSSQQGPSNDALQASNVGTIVNHINADIYGFAEVVDTTLFRNTLLPTGYNVIFSEFGSYADNKSDVDYPLTQKLAFMYRTDLIKPIKTYGILRDTYNPAVPATSADGTPYKNWSSGRFPFAMEAEVNINGKKDIVTFIEIHAKANTGTTADQIDAYNRRKSGNLQLKTWLDANLAGKKVIILGDFNDVLDANKTIAPMPAGTGTSYSDFTNDAVNYFPITLPLSLAGKQSTTGFNTVIDNVIITKSLNDNYIPGTAEVLDGVVGLVSNYSSTTTDHYPIKSRYLFGNGEPTLAAIANSSICYNNSNQTITLSGISPGPETSQTTSLSVASDNANLFDLLTVNSTGPNTAVLTYHLKNNISGSATITVTVTDDGGTAFGGINTTSKTFTLTVKSLATATISGTTTVNQNTTNPLITFTGTNGVAPYTFTYNINGGTNQTITTTSGNSVTVASPTNVAGSFVYNLVSIADANCSQAQSGSATVTIRPLPTGTISGNASVCINGSTPTITFTGSSGTAPYTFTYTINGGATRTITSTSAIATLPASTAVSGTFTYTLISVSDAFATQVQSGSVTVVVNSSPTISISSSTLNISKGAALVLNANGAASYTWIPNKDIISGQGTANLTIRPKQTTTYTVTGLNASGCSSTQNITIQVIDDYKIKPLNIISPNGDGKNDKFVIENIDYYPNNILKIFDRAGRIVYTKHNYQNEWDGTYNGSPLASDTYYYIIDFGSNIAQFKGYVTIVRN